MSNVNLGKSVQTLTKGKEFDSYMGVIIHAGQDSAGNTLDYSAGNSSGYVLEIDNPTGTQAMAQAILDGLKLRHVRYQPFSAMNAILDPSAEIGDSINVNGTTSTIHRISTIHSNLMAADVAAPYDEEVDHEFGYESKTTREFKRESAYTRSRLTINEEAITAEVVRATSSEETLSGRIQIAADAITAEVSRATTAEGLLSSRVTATAEAITAEVSRANSAEGTLSSRITQNANSITSEVTARQNAVSAVAGDLEDEVSRATGAESTLSSRITQNATDITAKVSKSGGSSSSFAWTLTDSSWKLTSNGTDVLVATASGLSLTGAITATSGTIGGWQINANNILKRVTGSFQAGLFAPGAPGASNAAIAVQDWNNSAWRDRFRVNYGGKLYAAEAEIEGKITATSGTIGGVTIANGVLSGINDTNIQQGGISGGSGGSIGGSTITTANTVSGINTSLGYANFSNGVFGGTNTASYCGASYVTASTRLSASNEFYYRSTPVSWQSQKVVVDSAGTTVTIRYLGN